MLVALVVFLALGSVDGGAAAQVVQAAARGQPALNAAGSASRGQGVMVRALRALAAAGEGLDTPPSGRPGGVPAWRLSTFDDRPQTGWKSVSGVLVPRRGGTGTEGAAAPSPASGGSSIDAPPEASMYLRLRFDVDEPTRVVSLELSVLYHDGFVAYLDGREIARRNVPGTGPAGASGGTRPRVPHGNEPEHVYIPIGTAGGGARLRARDNLLALRVIPAASRSASDVGAPLVEVGVAAFTSVRLVRGPYLVLAGDDALAVAWETDLPARGAVTLEAVAEPPSGRNGGGVPGAGGRGGASRAASSSSSSSSSSRPARPRVLRALVARLRQVVRLPALEPGRRYRYSVEVERPGADGSGPGRARAQAEATAVSAVTGGASEALRSAPAELSAPPPRRGPDRFVVYGDMRAPGHAAHAQVVAAILRERPTLVLNTGDLVAAGGEESAWQRYFEITRSLGEVAPVVPALGNHEAYLAGSARSWALFGLPSAGTDGVSGYASFDWGALHFVVLDTNHLDSRQTAWLVRDLAAARRKHPRAIFAVCHEGPWSSGPHGGSRAMERDLVPLLVAGGVSLLFAGHDHLYERGIGTVAGHPGVALPYVVTGGGGAPLYNPTCQTAGPSGSLPPPSSSPTLPTSLSVAPLPPCPSSVAIVRKAYHYLVVEVDDRAIHVCPRAPDGTLLEPCWSPP